MEECEQLLVEAEDPRRRLTDATTGRPLVTRHESTESIVSKYSTFGSLCVCHIEDPIAARAAKFGGEPTGKFQTPWLPGVYLGRDPKNSNPPAEVEKLKQAMLAKAQLQFALFAKTKKTKNAKNKQSRPLDFAQAWGERLSDPPQDRPPREGEEEVLEMHIGMVASNEYTEKDEHWLFTGDEGEKWIEANSMEKTMSNGSKHLKLRHVRVSEKQKQLFFCDTKKQEADSFTKSLGEAIYGMMASQ